MKDIFLTNSLTRKKEKFVAINPPHASLYTCGQTVYDYTHIGHGRKYVMDDILIRFLTSLGYKVKHVQNVTDVGHLSSDSDEGEDKLEKGAEKLGKDVWEVARFFTKYFYDSMDKLNVLRPDIIAKATDHIADQIGLIKKLFDKGLAYDTPEAVYFDIGKFEGYGELFGQKLEEKKVAVRQEVKTGEYKKHPADFALWFKRVGRFENHAMHWESPWGDGFPGWHIECSAMSMKYLGEQFDIHTGGVDHISIHHPNEIAQSEGATGKKPFVRFWLHYAFLNIDGKKMSKSLGNLFTVDDIEKRGFDPLALRYLFLTAKYKDPLNFTWESLKGAQATLDKLRSFMAGARTDKERKALSEEKLQKVDEFRDKFMDFLADDLNTPKAITVVWEVIKSNIPSTDKYDLIASFDEVLGLKLSEVKSSEVTVPDNIKELVLAREEARKKGDFKEADRLRGEIEEKGFYVEDLGKGPQIRPK